MEKGNLVSDTVSDLNLENISSDAPLLMQKFYSDNDISYCTNYQYDVKEDNRNVSLQAASYIKAKEVMGQVLIDSKSNKVRKESWEGIKAKLDSPIMPGKSSKLLADVSLKINEISVDNVINKTNLSTPEDVKEEDADMLEEEEKDPSHSNLLNKTIIAENLDQDMPSPSLLKLRTSVLGEDDKLETSDNPKLLISNSADGLLNSSFEKCDASGLEGTNDRVVLNQNPEMTKDDNTIELAVTKQSQKGFTVTGIPITLWSSMEEENHIDSIVKEEQKNTLLMLETNHHETLSGNVLSLTVVKMSEVDQDKKVTKFPEDNHHKMVAEGSSLLSIESEYKFTDEPSKDCVLAVDCKNIVSDDMSVREQNPVILEKGNLVAVGNSSEEKKSNEIIVKDTMDTKEIPGVEIRCDESPGSMSQPSAKEILNSEVDIITALPEEWVSEAIRGENQEDTALVHSTLSFEHGALIPNSLKNVDSEQVADWAAISEMAAGDNANAQIDVEKDKSDMLAIRPDLKKEEACSQCVKNLMEENLLSKEDIPLTEIITPSPLESIEIVITEEFGLKPGEEEGKESPLTATLNNSEADKETLNELCCLRDFVSGVREENVAIFEGSQTHSQLNENDFSEVVKKKTHYEKEGGNIESSDVLSELQVVKNSIEKKIEENQLQIQQSHTEFVNITPPSDNVNEEISFMQETNPDLTSKIQLVKMDEDSSEISEVDLKEEFTDKDHEPCDKREQKVESLKERNIEGRDIKVTNDSEYVNEENKFCMREGIVTLPNQNLMKNIIQPDVLENKVDVIKETLSGESIQDSENVQQDKTAAESKLKEISEMTEMDELVIETSPTHTSMKSLEASTKIASKNVGKEERNIDEKSKEIKKSKCHQEGMSKIDKVEESRQVEDSQKLFKRTRKRPEIEIYRPGMGLKKRTIKDKMESSALCGQRSSEGNCRSKVLSHNSARQLSNSVKSSTAVEKSNSIKAANTNLSESKKDRPRTSSLSGFPRINYEGHNSKLGFKDCNRVKSQERSTSINAVKKEKNSDIDSVPASKRYSLKVRTPVQQTDSQQSSSFHKETSPLADLSSDAKSSRGCTIKAKVSKDDCAKLKANRDKADSQSENEDKNFSVQYSKHKRQKHKKLREEKKRLSTCEMYSSEVDEWDESLLRNKKLEYANSDEVIHQMPDSDEAVSALKTGPLIFYASRSNMTQVNSCSSENLSRDETTETEDEIFEKKLHMDNKCYIPSHLKNEKANISNTQHYDRSKPLAPKEKYPNPTKVKLKNEINEQKSKEVKVSIPEKGKENFVWDENLYQKIKKIDKSNRPDSQSKVNERQSKGGGIIRLPTESVQDPCPFSSLTNGFQVEKVAHPDEPPVVQKQLFDPNNPDKPLLINVPCSHISYSGPSSPIQTLCGFAYPEHYGSSFASVPGQSWQYSPHPTPYSTDYPMDFSAELLLRQEGQKRIKPIVEKNLREISVLERELASYVAQGFEIVDSKPLGQCWQKLQLYFENIILAQPRYCAENNVEQLLWKTVFYQVIEALRRKAERTVYAREGLNETIIKIVDKGTVYFENLLMKQQETFGFELDRFLDTEDVWPKDIPDTIRMTLISVQKLLIYLGDLSRYREQANKTSNYGKARSWYLKAQQIAPKNGRPYNQLAIVAVHTKRKLDAVYYYMRSLAASNPFLSARESLLSLFEEIRKKYEVLEKQRLEEEKAQSAAKLNKKSGDLLDEEEKYEIWIHPDGSSSKRSSNLDNEQKDELMDLTSADLNKKFLLSFLHVHGKLFTKIGMETFTETVNKMLEEFNCLLRRSPLPLGALRLVQLLAIDLFAVANTTLKGVEKDMNPDCRSLLQEQALQVTFAMVSLLLERTIALVQEHFRSASCSEFVTDDLSQILPVIKIWTDWMSCHHHLWIPPPATGDFKIGCHREIWTLFADLLTALQAFDTHNVNFIKTREEGYKPVVLPEDNSMAGFLPLTGAVKDPMYAKAPFDKEQVRNCLRRKSIQFFGDYLCGMASPYLEFDVETKRFVSLVLNSESVENSEAKKETKWESSEDDIDSSHEVEESLGKNEGTSQSQEEKEIQKLWLRKEALKRAKEAQDNHQAQIQAVLQETRRKRPTVLEVRPYYLVPDTNCFIDHLAEMKSLLGSGQFRIVVPLVVINELDGLARGCQEDGGIPVDVHTCMVGQLAKDAILFLEERFASRDSRLRAITSKGSVLDTISFRSEDVSDSKGTNDDLILSCCLHYCKDRPEQFMPRDPDSPVRLLREAALLTEDRNLRVKALAQNVPVRDLPAFLRWAKIR